MWRGLTIGDSCLSPLSPGCPVQVWIPLNQFLATSLGSHGLPKEVVISKLSNIIISEPS